MNEEIDFNELQSSFDIKAFIFKVISYWKVFVLTIAIGLSIAYYKNVRKENIYKLNSLISVENEQNPFFTSNTSISFNWGGVTNKVQTVMTTLKTRSHNEKVLDSLQYYIQYLEQGKYRKNDIYKNAPFIIDIDKSQGQLLGQPIGIRFLNDNEFEIFTAYESNISQAQIYSTKEKIAINIPSGEFTKKFRFGERINLPFLNGTINRRELLKPIKGAEFYIQFLNFDSVVNQYKNLIAVEPYSKGSSVLTLSLTGSNKSKIVDFLNATTEILSKTELERKNLYATKTIKFIDSSLAAVSGKLKDVEDEMNTFRKENKLFNIDAEGSKISDELKEYDFKKREINTTIEYLNSLEKYLLTKTDYTNIAAPTTAGINETNIVASVRKIIDLSTERQKLQYTTKESSDLFKDIDRRINAEKNVLLETINSTVRTLRIQLNTVNNTIANLEYKLSELPQDQQKFLKIQRKFNLSDQAYNIFQAKRGEAAVVKAANVSDINVIDEAKDIGGGLIGPDTKMNYIIAIFVGILIPLAFIVLITFLDNNIHTVADIEKLSKIPVLGIIGKYKNTGNLAVINLSLIHI